MRAQVRQNRGLEEDERALLEAKLADVGSALTAFEQVAGRGEERRQQMKPVMVAGTAVLADDVTGIGAADDPFLVVAALAAVIVHVRTQAPASDQELQAALNHLDSVIEAAVKAAQAVLMSQQVGEQVRSQTHNIAQTLARLLNRDVGGWPPDHQQKPKQDRKHWWREIMTFYKEIQSKGLTPKQLLSRLQGGTLRWRFTPGQLLEIRQALAEAAKLMGEKPPDFPPLVMP